MGGHMMSEAVTAQRERERDVWGAYYWLQSMTAETDLL